MLFRPNIPFSSPGKAVALLFDRCDNEPLTAFGSTEKSARSCGSVSRIRFVISWFPSRALVKIFGGGKLSHISGHHDQNSERHTADLQWLSQKDQSVQDGCREASC